MLNWIKTARGVYVAQNFVISGVLNANGVDHAWCLMHVDGGLIARKRTLHECQQIAQQRHATTFAGKLHAAKSRVFTSFASLAAKIA